MSVIVAWAPFSSISRHRNARAIAFTIALSRAPPGVGAFFGVPSGAMTSLRPPRLRIEMGILTVTVVPLLLMSRAAVMPPSGILVSLRVGPLPDWSVLRCAGEYPNRRGLHLPALQAA